ncbi:beta-xylosidase [Nitrospirillum sp. BR 11164]|uniref:GH39 family glycosyl hydrolase n=1 Tax=Nitrospirillum sp. BR 11164 TaxID=3104324 RepID=UPI002AFE64DE|nr:beta-xylosidase [Nitrospirillum sp. BR 11164]MEA1648717.1 beta-xylosidase [Nitrospirillum sp. BR 11164]
MAARGWRSEDGRKGRAAGRQRRVRALAAGLLALSLSSRPGLAQPVPTPVTITVDLAHAVGPTHPLYAWFGYDEANYTTMRDGRALLSELHDLAPVPVHIRTHHLLSSGDGVAALKWSSTNVYSEDAAGNPVYDFHILDGIFDAYRDAGVVPMVELGFTPKALASGAGTYEDVYPDAAIGGTVHSPPKDHAKWRALIRTVVAHLAQRYGRETVTGWYFEVWNEPDIPYWHGTPAQYFQLYDTTVAAVRDVLPQAKVGGPATTGPGGASGAQFLKDFLDHVAATRAPLDFISFHAKGQPTFQDGQVTMGLAQELTDVDKGFGLVARYPRFRHLPIILSEADPEGCAACSMSVNPANAYRNGALYPAYTAAAYKRLFELADRHGVNLAAMLSWSFEFEGRAYFEGFRDLSTNGVDKPILNFFRMAAMLRGTRVATTGATIRNAADIIAHGVRDAPDIDALATADARGAAVMVWNYHDAATPADPTPVALTLTGLPKAAVRVRLSHYRIDDHHSNAYTAWQAMGSPQNPTPAQLADLKGQAGLQLAESPRWLAPSGGTATLTLDMPRQSVSLLALDW